MILFYLIQLALCFLIFLVTSKTIDGKITRADILAAVVVSVIPVVNTVVCLGAILELLKECSESEFWNKKVF